MTQVNWVIKKLSALSIDKEGQTEANDRGQSMPGVLRTVNDTCDFNVQSGSDTGPKLSPWHPICQLSALPITASEGENTSMPAPWASSYQQLPGETTSCWLPSPHPMRPIVACWRGPGSKLRMDTFSALLLPLSLASHSSVGFRRGKQESWHPGTPNLVTVLATVLMPRDLDRAAHHGLQPCSTIPRTEGGEGRHSRNHQRICSPF